MSKSNRKFRRSPRQMTKKENLGGIEIRVSIEANDIWQYNRKVVAGSLIEGAKDIIKTARRLVSRRTISAAGEYPGYRTGALHNAIGIVKVGSKGGYVRAGVNKTKEMGKHFYPAFLYHGVRNASYFKNSTPKSRRRLTDDQRAALASAHGYRLAQRDNYMTAAFESKRSRIRQVIRTAVIKAIVTSRP